MLAGRVSAVDDMVCSIPGKQVKVFGKAIHTLSKLSDDLYIEADSKTFALRTVNSARSAYACYDFDRQFFSSYNVTRNDGAESSNEPDAVCCKTQSKSCLATFRSLSQLDKSVTRCKLRLNLRESFLEVQLHCKHGVVKTHKLHIEDADSIQAVYDVESMKGEITVPPRLLSDTMVHFHNSTDEITFILNSKSLEIMNWTDDTAGPLVANHLCTRVELHKDEFSGYHVGQSAKLTFCLKELRAICSFCDYLNVPLRAVFEAAGTPIIFLIRTNEFSADFVMSTVNNDDDPDNEDEPATGMETESQGGAAAQNHTGSTPQLAGASGSRRPSSGPSSFTDTQPRTGDDDMGGFRGSGATQMEMEVPRSEIVADGLNEFVETPAHSSPGFGRRGKGQAGSAYGSASQRSKGSAASAYTGKQRRIDPYDLTPRSGAASSAAGVLVQETPQRLTDISPYIASMGSITDRRQPSSLGAMSLSVTEPETAVTDDAETQSEGRHTPPGDDDSDDEVPATPPRDSQGFTPFFRGKKGAESMEF